MILRPSRSGDGEVVHLAWRLRIFAAAAVLALVGMVLRIRWPIWVAIAVLLLGLVLRFVPERRGDPEPPAPSADEEDREDAS